MYSFVPLSDLGALVVQKNDFALNTASLRLRGKKYFIDAPKLIT